MTLKLRPYTVGYNDSYDGPIREWCCYAYNSFEARVIAIQDCPVIRKQPTLIKYIFSED